MSPEDVRPRLERPVGDADDREQVAGTRGRARGGCCVGEGVLRGQALRKMLIEDSDMV